jgi:hypothetical protein
MAHYAKCLILNQTQCTSYKCKNYYGRKVCTVNATAVEWVECEHVNKTGLILQLETQIHDVTCQLDSATKEGQPCKLQIQSTLEKLRNRLSTEISNQKFKLELEQCSPKYLSSHLAIHQKKVEFCCKMKQISANSNDATTGHKLQGMSKDVIVVTSWPTGGLAAMFKNWEYVVLFQVGTLSGLYLVEPIDMDKLFKPSSELKKYMENFKTKRNKSARKTKMCDSATKLAVKVCGNGQ